LKGLVVMVEKVQEQKVQATNDSSTHTSANKSE
jgi:hypothetical protein